ncbi:MULTISPECIES: hypothetical protein [Methylococcus]|jgi:hypothetical protein|uniref:hypothetical protein n=1 Tax=Methylococcus TaxID=413 RepID=UPI0002F487C2|nr:hypothetical protein [Methylococcus capsulatus]QXP86808.1 hypothetical protein KW112_10465 [Methylococcus capsulatus]QXP91864.1 hypothetical protein KW114_06930 [Methylococcus capsulatus]QXP93514.1 hypothetical protein KW113_14395 [Methylococcus capsulatus]UQN11782.1 hypothetical protein M3M30_12215 [Methylococcus capsulatus]
MSLPGRVRDILTATARPFLEETRCAPDLLGACGAGIVDARAVVEAVQCLQ